MIKLIASDMDGTLLSGSKELPPDFFETLSRLKEKNVRFVAASGRSYVTLYRNFRPRPDELDYICDNGAFVVMDGGVASSSPLPREGLRELVRACETLPDVQAVLCGLKGTYHLASSEEFMENIRMYYVNHRQVEDLAQVDDQIFKVAICDLNGPENGAKSFLDEKFGGQFDMPVTGPLWMDVMNLGVNKGQALKKIQEKLDISPEETMCFGDFMNDAELLDQAYYSFAMANAHPDLAARSRFRALSNDQNGVMEAIREYVL